MRELGRCSFKAMDLDMFKEVRSGGLGGGGEGGARSNPIYCRCKACTVAKQNGIIYYFAVTDN